MAAGTRDLRRRHRRAPAAGPRRAAPARSYRLASGGGGRPRKAWWCRFLPCRSAGLAAQPEEPGPQVRAGGRSCRASRWCGCWTQSRGRRASGCTGAPSPGAPRPRAGGQDPVQCVGELLADPLLHGEPAREQPHQPGQLGQPQDVLVRDVPDVGPAEERQAVMLSEKNGIGPSTTWLIRQPGPPAAFGRTRSPAFSSPAGRPPPTPRCQAPGHRPRPETAPGQRLGAAALCSSISPPVHAA